MRLETNFVQVENNPQVINKVNSVAAAFGWTVQNIQVIDSSVAYESDAVGWTTEFGTFVKRTISINRTTYASITYQRDLDDSKYPEWVELERQYNESLAGRNRLTEEEYQYIDQTENAAKEKADRLVILRWVSIAAVILMTQVVLIALIIIIIYCLVKKERFSVGEDLKLMFKSSEKIQSTLLARDEAYQQLVIKDRMLGEAERDAILARARALANGAAQPEARAGGSGVSLQKN